MRKNRILGAATAAALLSMPVGVAYAAGGLANGPGGVVTTPEGIIYASELFGSVDPPGDPSLPSTPANGAQLTYTLTNTVADPEQLRFTLSEGMFAAHPTLVKVSGTGDCGGCAFTQGGSEAKYTQFGINAGTAGDIFMLSYSVKGIAGSALVTMTTSMTGDVSRTANIIQPALQAVTAEIKPQTSGSVKISVNDAEMKFVGSIPSDAKVSETEAEIGLIQVTNLSGATHPLNPDADVIYDSTGAAPFIFPAPTTTDDAAVGSLNKLEITGGQFDASTATNMVYIDTDDNDSFTPGEPSATVDAATDTATFTLDDAQMGALAGGSFYPIRMQVTGTTVINTAENPPKATLTINFLKGDDTTNAYGVEGHVIEGDLLQIKRDGTECIVFNVHKGEPTMPADYATLDPKPKSPFGSSIRMTNKTGIDGKLTAILYDKDGNILGGPATLTEAIKPGVTEVFDSWAIRDLLIGNGGSWAGRAMMVVTSTLSKMEMLALLRHEPGGPLTNVSIGASGASCKN